VPASFLARRLILDDAVNNEYRNLNAGAPHLVAMYGVYRALEEAEKLAKVPEIDWGLLDRLKELKKQAEDMAIKVDELVGPIAQAEVQVKAAQEVIKAHDQAIATQEAAVNAARDALNQVIDAESQARSLLTDLPNRQGHG
jgi:hypothetical protein